jgi:hypothetical protein
MNSKKTKEVAVIDFKKFSVAQLPELNGKKEEIKSIIDANPEVDVLDNATYELAKKSRTAVKSLRTGLEKEQKEVKKKIKEFVLDVVDKEYDALILSVKNQENIRQEPIDIWEAKKEEERLEKLRLEELRVKNIKEVVQAFIDAWKETISCMIYENVSEAKSYFEKTISEFDRVKLEEFEILFDDAVGYLDNLINAKIQQLESVEKIRLEQLRITEELEKQRIENEKISELYRIEREKFEAEQKLALENQRIAQEKFLKEKKEFEEKQAEVKRIADEKAKSEQSANERVFESIPLTSKSEVSIGNTIHADYHEADVDPKGLSTRHKANTPAVKKELTWDDIMNEYTTTCLLGEDIFLSFLKDNFNVPTRKI